MDWLIDSPYFRIKMKNIMKDNQQRRPMRHRSSGIVDTKTIYKATTNGRCFYNKTAIGAKNYTIELLLDCSGSMGDRNKMVLANQAVCQFITDFWGIAHITVRGFGLYEGTDNNGTIRVVYNNEKPTAKILQKITEIQNYGGTPTGKATQQAIDYLKTKNTKKLIVVLTDGEPNSKETVINQNNRAKQYGIEVIAVGIQSKHVETMYDSYIVINKLEELQRGLLLMLNAKIKRRSI